MNEPIRTQFEIRCAFNAFCKRALECEASNAYRELRKEQSKRVTFSDLTPEEEDRLCTTDRYFADDEAEQYFSVAGREFTAKQLSDAIRSLPEEKRDAVLLSYFFDMSDAEIGRLRDIPKSTVQYRRTSSLELLKRYLEGRAYEAEEF